MTKRAVYTCTKCDAQFPKWAGRCLSCGAWGSISQEATQAESNTGSSSSRLSPLATPAKVSSFQDADVKTISECHPTGLVPFDAVLGGGLVRGSVTLLAGEPGIGKSTFLAQLGLRLAERGKKVIYVTGEESPSQICRRLERLTPTMPPSFHFLDHTEADTIAATIAHEQPDLTIIDSIQSLRLPEASGEAGSPAQVKACAATLTTIAKKNQHSLVIVGQVTKEGDVAGPRLLEHLVDTFLFLEGDRMHRYRVLRTMKHRFGPTDEVALLAMTEKGLEPVEDASQELIRDRPVGVAGSCITCLLEGHRPVLLEIQALVSPAGYAAPIRRTTGIDTARLGMLLAVLGRRAGINALDKDVYANAAGGIDARDPSVDLAIATSIASAVRDLPLDPRMGLFGEIGLGGELRPVSLPEMRLKEMARLGFTQAVTPRGQGKNAPAGLAIKEASTLREALQMMHLL